MYREDLTDILNNWVTALKFPCTIYTVTAIDANNWTLGISDIYHLMVGYEVTNGANTYTITAINATATPSPTITVTGTVAPVAQTSLGIYSPIFAHGTVRETQAENVQTVSPFKQPVIWLEEGFTEKFYNDPESVLERESQICLYFLCSADFNQTTEQLYESVVQPMQRLKQNFINYIDTYGTKPPVDKWEQTDKDRNYYNLGVFIKGKGMPKGLFSDQLSGISCDLNLVLYVPNPPC